MTEIREKVEKMLDKYQSLTKEEFEDVFEAVLMDTSLTYGKKAIKKIINKVIKRSGIPDESLMF